MPHDPARIRDTQEWIAKVRRDLESAAALLASGMVTACGATGGTGGAGGYQGGRLQFGEPGPWPVANFTYGAADGIQETPVVGTSTATWRPSMTVLNAARIATSVLPKPTSPQISRSIGLGFSRSALVSRIARI